MKVSVSLPAEDIQFLDEYARRHQRSRSAAVHEAITTLRDGTLPDAYAQAWGEWDADSDAEPWEQTSGDGL
jgi:Arc/MetJ-type ribon-helix-helix transcriptional regulator